MKIGKLLRRSLSAIALSAAAVLGVYFYAVTPHTSSAPAGSGQYLLDQADALSWGNLWAKAEPVYKQAESKFITEQKPSKALYARVSQIPPNENVDVPATILVLTDDLKSPEAADPETRLRILTIRGMLETNANAADAVITWEEIEKSALQLHHYGLATRALGEQGIAAFLLGDAETAKKKVVRAWTLSKLERDPAATVRYASVFGAGLVEIRRFKEALTPLDEAIKLARGNPNVAYPSIAIYAKISALTGLHKLDEALALANSSLQYLDSTPFAAHKEQVLQYRGDIYRDGEDWSAATADYRKAVAIASSTNNYRATADASGLLAQAYQHDHRLDEALAAINNAIDANARISGELYLVPRNLATKAEILAEMGRVKEAEVLYQDSILLIETILQHASTANIERLMLSQVSQVYSGYYVLLAAQHRYADALRVIEKIKGRVETEALEHHANETIHPPTPEEQELTRLNRSLIQTSDPAARETLGHMIYTTELELNPSVTARETVVHPVDLKDLQRSLGPRELLIEYVLSSPRSYVLAITDKTVTPYTLPSKVQIEADARRYVGEIHSKKVDVALAQTLYDQLLAPVTELAGKQDLIVVPDLSLHLLPFAALAHDGAYVLTSHTVDVVPSATVFQLLRRRADSGPTFSHPYVGVAAWTQPVDTRPAVVRAVSGPRRSELVPLPQSRAEIESIAKDLPSPSTILLGADATETNFKNLAKDDIEVVHLALHGFVDNDFPDRSALVFAPEAAGANDALLQVREIRQLRLNSKLVTLSACNTGVGPVGEAGVANLVNAFIEAGAESVVSTLWEIEDQATRHLMEMFYSHLAAGSRKVDALRAAQLDILERGYPPYFWAGVEIVGDPDGTL